MKEGIQILLVDDHQVVREGLRHMLELETDMEVAGEAADAKEALAQVESLLPEVVLMDIKMPGMDGIELTQQLKEKQPSCKVIMLTLYDEYLAQAIEAGAAGYLLKDITRTELAQAIRQVQRGEVVISKALISKSQIEEEQITGENVEEVQLVIHPPVGAAQLMEFVSRVEETLQSRVLQMVGSWDGGTTITIPLPKPTPLANILDKLAEVPEIETAAEKPLANDPTPLKRAESIPKSRTRLSKIIFVTLRMTTPDLSS